jgi:hypothetical protein
MSGELLPTVVVIVRGQFEVGVSRRGFVSAYIAARWVVYHPGIGWKEYASSYTGFLIC